MNFDRNTPSAPLVMTSPPMRAAIAIDVTNQIVLVVLSGFGTVAGHRKLLNRVLHNLRSNEMNRVLVDARNLNSESLISDLLSFGAKIVASADDETRFACTIHVDDPADESHTFELRDQNEELRAFTNPNAAIDWLRS